jgi:hypothetical protein
MSLYGEDLAGGVDEQSPEERHDLQELAQQQEQYRNHLQHNAERAMEAIAEIHMHTAQLSKLSIEDTKTREKLTRVTEKILNYSVLPTRKKARRVDGRDEIMNVRYSPSGLQRNHDILSDVEGVGVRGEVLGPQRHTRVVSLTGGVDVRGTTSKIQLHTGDTRVGDAILKPQRPSYYPEDSRIPTGSQRPHGPGFVDTNGD